jgi:GTPase
VIEVESKRTEKALLVGITSSQIRKTEAEEHLEELARLTDTAGAVVIDKIIQHKESIDPALFIGRGKAEEIGLRIIPEEIDLVIFDDDLSPVQSRNLEKLMKCKIIDRSGLILQIFAQRARSREARTQVELAQLQYLLPRLTRQWTHLSKQYGGIGTKGPGETQIETDRRMIRTRISTLKQILDRISQQRETQRKKRTEFTRVSIVGYTNAGKSTLMNLLSSSEILVEDRLFATLDATVRGVNLSPAHKILLSDTVGFIRKLPPHLVASFKSTLEEVAESDILLHVVDASSPMLEEHITVVNETLKTLNALGKPTVIVFNKIDLVEDREYILRLMQDRQPSCAISAARAINIESLKENIIKVMDRQFIEKTLVLSHQNHQLISQLHSIAEIVEKRYENNHIHIRFRINRKDEGNFERLIARTNS